MALLAVSKAGLQRIALLFARRESRSPCIHSRKLRSPTSVLALLMPNSLLRKLIASSWLQVYMSRRADVAVSSRYCLKLSTDSKGLGGAHEMMPLDSSLYSST